MSRNRIWGAGLATIFLASMAVSATISYAASTGVMHSPLNMNAPARTSAQLQEILKQAQPMEKLLGEAPAALQLPSEFKSPGPPVVVPGEVGGPQQSASDIPYDEGDSSAIAPDNYGSGNLATIYHYSDRMVNTRLRKQYPERATGFFLFKNGGAWYYCSGSMISRSIVLVAGHCVHSGNNSPTGWNSEGYFYPSAVNMNGGGTPITPYGVASAAQYWTWSSWYSTGALDQGYDVGLVVLNTRNNDPRKTYEMGRFTGTYGFCLSNCLQPYWELTQLGYPGNYYGGNRMTQGNHIYMSDGKDYQFGSGMRGGSSGGPHVANLGSLSDSATDQGQWTFRNIVFAPTSWGYVSEAWKIQGASSLSGPGNAYLFKNLYNPACTTSRTLHGTKSCTLQ